MQNQKQQELYIALKRNALSPFVRNDTYVNTFEYILAGRNDIRAFVIHTYVELLCGLISPRPNPLAWLRDESGGRSCAGETTEGGRACVRERREEIRLRVNESAVFAFGRR